MSIIGVSAALPNIMWQEVMIKGNRRPYRPSAQRFSRLRKLFKPRYLRGVRENARR